MFELLLRYIFYVEEFKNKATPEEQASINPTSTFLQFYITVLKDPETIMNFVIHMLMSSDYFEMKELYKEIQQIFIQKLKHFSNLSTDLKVDNK